MNIMINFDEVIGKNTQEHNPHWPQIPDHLYRTLMVGGSGSGKTNAVLNIINHQPEIDKAYLYAKDPCKSKYQLLINNVLGCPKTFRGPNGVHGIL